MLSNKNYYDFEKLMLKYVLEKTKDKSDPNPRYSYPLLTTDSIADNESLSQAIETFLTIVHVEEPKKSEKILQFMYGYKNSQDKSPVDEDSLVLVRLENNDDKAIDEAYSFLDSIVK